jgi:MoxR-like ATPase
MVFDSGESAFRFRPGPIFTNFLLADEINRTPPKTQAALLEAMEESQVSVGGQTYRLPDPFVTIATQNPIEYEGTYPLPEAQLDRFLLKLIMDYPTADQELEVLARHHRGLDPHRIEAAGVTAVASPDHITAARRLVQQVHVDESILRYIVELCRATRSSTSVIMGVSPRGATALLHATKAWTWLAGRPFTTPDEVQAIARPALRHRMLLRPELELDGLTTDAVLDSILAAVPAPR